MSRDRRRLCVFVLADDLVTQVDRATRYFPDTERYGLQSQLWRAALSAATNIVEGSARRSTKDYLNFLNIDATSASETRHLVEVSQRLRLLTPTQGSS